MCTQEGIGRMIGRQKYLKHNNLEFAIYNLDFMKIWSNSKLEFLDTQSIEKDNVKW